MKNTKTTNILLVIIIVILLAPGLLLGLVYVSSMINMGPSYRGSGITQSTPKPFQYSTPRQAADLADSICRQMFRDDYNTALVETEGQFLVDVWVPHLDDEAIDRTKSGEDPEELTVWDSLTRDLIDSADTVQRVFNDSCKEDITVVLSLCNPEDQSKKYLTIANGIAGYDIVKGTDLRKAPET